MLTSEIKKLSYAEKLLLINDLWDDVSSRPEEIALTENQKQILDKRYEGFLKDPKEGSSWDEVKMRILKDL